MHDTLDPSFKGDINSRSFVTVDGVIQVRIVGWAFHTRLNTVEFRLRRADGETQPVENKEREDVAAFYHNPDLKMCGFDYSIPSNVEFQLEGLVAETWKPVFHFKNYNFTLNTKVPTYIVVDDFYSDPDSIREYALAQTFNLHPTAHKGRRTETLHKFQGLQERFEQVLGCKIKDWNAYCTNCSFQYCIAGDQLVYHQDTQEYAGVLFLTPNAPPECGTQLYRSRVTGKMSNEPGPEHNAAFQGGFYDRTKFQLIDTVGNVYNRLVLFDARCIHAASEYFGTDKYNGRLFQLFFFDLVKE